MVATVNNIQRLQRAIFAQIHPLTGVRATGGTATFTAEAGGGDVLLPPNTYLIPVVGTQVCHDRLFKVSPNPATATGSIANGTWQGGEWTVPDGSTLDVGIVSNLGGPQHNLRTGTVLRLSAPVAGLQDTATIATAPSGGSAEGALVKRFCVWENMSVTEAATQFFQAGAGEFPALMIGWESSSPLEGRTTGGNQGSTRKGRKVRAFREQFRILIAAGELDSHHGRRKVGELAMLCATDLLSDRQLNIDCELLSQTGSGLEVIGRRPAAATRGMYIYEITFTANTVIKPIDNRSYSDFARLLLTLALPGREAPEPTTPIPIVDGVETDLP